MLRGYKYPGIPFIYKYPLEKNFFVSNIQAAWVLRRGTPADDRRRVACSDVAARRSAPFSGSTAAENPPVAKGLSIIKIGFL